MHRFISSWILAIALLPFAVSVAVPVVDEGGVEFRRSPRRNDSPAHYLVVTDRALQGAFMPLVQARTHDGLPTAVVTLQTIESSYPDGVDLAERIRMFLRDAHANRGTQWVLLGGDASVVPVRRARLKLGPILGDRDLPTDQYYACLDGSWNADGDGLWGEIPRPGEPGDDVDFFPELFIGRAPVRTAAEAVAFVRRTLDYQDRLAATEPRSALLAAEVFGAGFDSAPFAEELRPALEADPDRKIVRLYENAASWPGSLQESRPALLDALDGGFDLAVLWGAGARGVILAGQDPVDRVTSEDLLGLTNAPLYPIVYALSAYTTDPGDPQSIGTALMRAPSGGAAAVLGTTDVQFVALGDFFMKAFFAEALGPAGTTIGEGLARAIAVFNAHYFPQDGERLTSQGMLLFGDPTLRIDTSGVPIAALRTVVEPGAVEATAARAADALEGLTLAIPGQPDATIGALHPVATAARRESKVEPARAVLETPSPSLARSETTVRFDLPRGAAGAPYVLEVFAASGRRVRTLAGGVATPGRYEIRWDLRSDAGAPVPRGVYFVRLDFAGISQAHRVLVLR